MSTALYRDDEGRRYRNVGTGRQYVDGLAVFDELEGLLRRHVAFPSAAALTAVTLWAAHAHVVDAFESTPRLALLSPEKGSGKTRTLEVLETVVPRPMHAVNCTAAALFRAVASRRPTLLFDEADTYFGTKSGEHEELRGLINAGHRRGAVAYRCVGDGAKMEVKEFPAFAAVALAGLGFLPDTIIDRAVVVKMKRRAPDEIIVPFRHREVAPVADLIMAQLVAWADSYFDTISTLVPDMPAGITDRPADVWEPLLAVADVAGGAWPERARRAAEHLNAERVAVDPSLGAQLLGDIRNIFTSSATDRLSSEELVERLCALEEAPWGDLRGKALDARGLARRLRQFDVRPHTIRVQDRTPKGYEQTDFYDAWCRYLTPQAEGATSATTETVAPVAVVADLAGENGRSLLDAFGEVEDASESNGRRVRDDVVF